MTYLLWAGLVFYAGGIVGLFGDTARESWLGFGFMLLGAYLIARTVHKEGE